MIKQLGEFFGPLSFALAALGGFALPLAVIDADHLHTYAMFVGVIVVLAAIRMLFLDHNQKDDQRQKEREKRDDEREVRLIGALNRLMEDRLDRLAAELRGEVAAAREVADKALIVATTRPTIPRTGEGP